MARVMLAWTYRLARVFEYYALLTENPTAHSWMPAV